MWKEYHEVAVAAEDKPSVLRNYPTCRYTYADRTPGKQPIIDIFAG